MHLPIPRKPQVLPCHTDKWPNRRGGGARELRKIRFAGHGLDLRARCPLLFEAPIPAIQVSASIPPRCNRRVRAGWQHSWAGSGVPACWSI